MNWTQRRALRLNAIHAGLMLSLVIVVGCADYEVLRLPQGSVTYTPGRKWISGTGPTSDILCESERALGVGKVNTNRKDDFLAKVSAPILRWIGGSLAVDAGRNVSLKAESLVHCRVKDLAKPPTEGLLLYETVSAESLRFTVTDKSGLAADAQIDAAKLAKTAEGNIQINVKRESTGSYRIESDKPLVFAIRVVEIRYDLAPRQEAVVGLDRHSVRNGAVVPIGLGYVLNFTGDLDEVRKQVTARITNPGLPQWKGTEPIVFSGSEAWVNDRREVIRKSDPRARGADFIWDTIHLEWNDDDRAKSKAVVMRQYMKIKRAKSGLKDVECAL